MNKKVQEVLSTLHNISSEVFSANDFEDEDEFMFNQLDYIYNVVEETIERIEENYD